MKFPSLSKLVYLYLYFLEIKTKLKIKTLVCSGSQGGMSAPYRQEDSILKAHEYESDRAGDSRVMNVFKGSDI